MTIKPSNANGHVERFKTHRSAWVAYALGTVIWALATAYGGGRRPAVWIFGVVAAVGGAHGLRFVAGQTEMNATRTVGIAMVGGAIAMWALLVEAGGFSGALDYAFPAGGGLLYLIALAEACRRHRRG